MITFIIRLDVQENKNYSTEQMEQAIRNTIVTESLSHKNKIPFVGEDRVVVVRIQ